MKTKYLYPVSFIILGFAIGLALGFFLGAIAFVEVVQQFTEQFTEGMNMSITVDFDEEAAIDYMIEVIEMDNETRRLLEEADTHPEQRNISQTVQNFEGFRE